MVVRNIRRSMVEYHDILWDIGYAKTFYEAYEMLDQLYAERPPLEDFVAWRDDRVMDEIHWCVFLPAYTRIVTPLRQQYFRFFLQTISFSLLLIFPFLGMDGSSITIWKEV